MKNFYIVVAAIAFVAVVFYTWCNRDSDRVLYSFATVVSIAVIGFITNELISNKPEQFSKEFPVVVFYGMPNYEPLFIRLPYAQDLGMCMQKIKSTDKPHINQTGTLDFDYAKNKYFEAFQYVVIKAIFDRFGMGWDGETKRIRTPNGERLSTEYGKESGKEIKFTDFLKEQIPNNYFVKLNPIVPVLQTLSEKAVFPPDTQISSKISDHDYLLTFKTKYISVEVKISMFSTSTGIGEYSRMFPDYAAKRVSTGTSVYLMSVSTKQATYLNGNPEMKKQRKWADSLAVQLDNTFNFEEIRGEHLKQFGLFGSSAIEGM